MKMRHVVRALAVAALTGGVVWALKRKELEAEPPLDGVPPGGSNGALPAAKVVIRKPRRLPRAAAAPRTPRRRSHGRRKSA